MNKIKPEFGNPDHIALLEKERKEKEKAKEAEKAFAEALERGEVGYVIVETETCGECGEETENHWHEKTHKNKNYILCDWCGSILDSHWL